MFDVNIIPSNFLRECTLKSFILLAFCRFFFIVCESENLTQMNE